MSMHATISGSLADLDFRIERAPYPAPTIFFDSPSLYGSISAAEARELAANLIAAAIECEAATLAEAA